MIKRTVKFILHKRNAADVTGLAIRMRCTIRGERPLDIATGHHVDAVDWDADKQCAIGKNASAINRTLNQWRSVMDEIFARYELIEKRAPAIDELRDLFNDMVGRAVPDTPAAVGDVPSETDDLFKVFDIFVDTMSKRNSWTDSTHEKFHALRNHLKSFDAHLSFVTLTDAKLSKYVDYLLATGMRNSTVLKNLGFVRWFIRWAALAGYYKGKVHETFKPRLKGASCKEVIYLTVDELRAIETHVFPPQRIGLEHVRDVFVFCCYSGLRFSDAAKLKRSDIHGDAIHVVTKKTRDALVIELNKHSRAILDKYAEAGLPDGKALPTISNVKTNAYLKNLGIECGIDEPTRVTYFTGNERHEYVLPKYQLLTTHVARRTFVVTALQLGIPAEVIMRYTGHSSFSAMKPYIAIVDELKRKSMNLFDEL